MKVFLFALLFVLVESRYYCQAPITLNGTRPVDTLDIICQYHALCRSALGNDCFCFAQYFSALLKISNDSIYLNEAYIAYNHCLPINNSDTRMENRSMIGTRMEHRSMIGTRMENRSMIGANDYYLGNTPGLNYFTLWSDDTPQAYIIERYNNLVFYTLPLTDYPIFTITAYQHAQNIKHYLSYNVTRLQGLLWIESDTVVVAILNDSSTIGYVRMNFLGDKLSSVYSLKSTVDMLSAQYLQATAASDNWYHQYSDCNNELDTLQGWYILALILIILIAIFFPTSLFYHYYKQKKEKSDVLPEAELARCAPQI